MRPRWIHFVLLVALAVVLAVVWGRGRVLREDRSIVLQALREAHGPRLPEASRAGALSSTEPTLYDKDSLYELIDGAAEAYLAHGFEKAAAATYAFDAPGGAVEVAAEAHRFGDAAGAQAQLALERPRQARPLAAVPGAISDGSVLLVVAGRDLLKLTRLDTRPEGGDALAALGAAWLQEKTP